MKKFFFGCDKNEMDTRLNEALDYLQAEWPGMYNCLIESGWHEQLDVVFGGSYWADKPDTTYGMCTYGWVNGMLVATVRIRTHYNDGTPMKVKTGYILHEFTHANTWLSGSYFFGRKFGKDNLKVPQEEINKMSPYAQISWDSGKFSKLDEVPAEGMRAAYNAYRGARSAVKVWNEIPTVRAWLQMLDARGAAGVQSQRVYDGKSFN